MKNLFSRKFSAVLSLVLVFALILGVAPTAVFAANDEKSESSKLVDIFYKEIVNKYLEEGYTAAYQWAVKNDVIVDAIAEIDEMIARVEELKAQIPELPELPDDPEEMPEEIPWEDIDPDFLSQVPPTMIDQLPDSVFESIPSDYLTHIPEDTFNQVSPETLEKLPQETIDELPDNLRDLIMGRLDQTNTPVQPMMFGLRAQSSNSSYEDLVDHINKYNQECDELLTTLNELKGLLEGDNLSTFEGFVEAVHYLENDLPVHINNLEELWVYIADYIIAEVPVYNENTDSEDVRADVLNSLSTLAEIENAINYDVIPAIDSAMEVAAESVYEPLCDLLGLFLEKQVGSADEIADAIGIISEMSDEEIKQRVKELIEDATHEEYVIDKNSYYVAFGNIYNRDTYAEALAKKLGVQFKNYTKADMTIEQMAESVSNYKDDITNADLITLNFGVVDSFLEVLNNIASSKADYDMDWVKYLGADAAEKEAKVDESLAKIYKELTDNGVDGKDAKFVVESVKLYAYQCVVHSVNLHKAVEKIKAINPEALIVVVGAYNPLSDATYNHKGEIIKIGEYIDYIFKAFSVYDLAYAIATDNVTFVDAPDVEVVLDEKEVDIDMYAKLNILALMPTEEGHEYIKEQIWNALIISTDLECEHTFGEWVQTVAPGCTTKGVETQTCSKCGKTNTKEIPELGHDWHWVIDKEATEDENGLKHEECKRCGEKRNEGTVIPKKDVIPPTGDNVIIVALTTVAFGVALFVLAYKRKYFLG